MARKFKIPAIPQTTQKNIRFPNDVIEDVERTIRGKRSEERRVGKECRR